MSEKLWSDWTDDIKENTKQIEALEKEIAELEKRVDGEVTEMKDNYAELKKGLNLRIDTQHDSDMRSLDIIGINELDIRHIKSVLTEWIDWTLESFNAGVNDEYLEKLKQIKKKLSAKDEKPPEPNKCEECGGFRMGENMMHNDGCSQCTTTTTIEKPPEQYCDNCTKQGNHDTFQCPGAKCIPERDFDPKPPDYFWIKVLIEEYEARLK